MAKHDDQALLESVRTHRERLRGAFLFGMLGTRRAAAPLVGRVLIGVVAAAVASAACVGVGFASDFLSRQNGPQNQGLVAPAGQSPSTLGGLPAPPTPADQPIENPAEQVPTSPAHPAPNAGDSAPTSEPTS